ncbi:LOW QUALITY PROTEIN: Transposable element Hobo transposase [Frankliniella fusca]|uniref:Transposable element Hobo transposase n=1 Tax=Frankliniella fusca TaxID=407009 RepID=A0AAE1GQI2_9NEOP|nr:LOW QUALITY PROTEIN: Transposable element Hobo transposase [Frankliniella fusca]
MPLEKKMGLGTLSTLRTTISYHVESRAEALRETLLPEIKSAMEKGFCAMTTDGCTEDHSKVHFFTATVQYCGEEEGKWVLKNKVLYTTPFNNSGRHTGADVREHIFKNCSDRGFPSSLIESVPFVTDGGSDIVVALNGVKRFYCFDHFLNVCLKNSFEIKVYQLKLYTEEALKIIGDILEVVQNIKKKPIGRKLVEVTPKGQKRGPFPSKLPLLRLFHKNYDNIKNYTVIDHIDRDKVLQLIEMMAPLENILKTCKTSIPASKFQDIKNLLVLKDTHSDFEKDLMQNFVKEFMALDVLQYVSDCKALVNHFKHYMSLMKELETTLKQCCETRLNSLLHTLETIRDQFDMVIQVLMDAEQYDWVSKIDNRVLLEAIISVLKPFEIESKAMQASQTPTFHLCLPSLYLLKRPLILLGSVRAQIHSELQEKAQITLEHKISTLLCPSFRSLKMLSPGEIAIVHSSIQEMISEISSEDLRFEIEPTPSPSNSPTNRYAEWCEEVSYELENELDRYLREPKGDDKDLLAWWQTRVQLHQENTIAFTLASYACELATDSSLRIYGDRSNFIKKTR